VKREILSQCWHCEGAGMVRVVNPGYLRATRKAAGLSLREVARRCGISAAYLSDVELGRRNCSLDRCAELEAAIRKGGAR
jgi:predicted transcriptional regulator